MDIPKKLEELQAAMTLGPVKFATAKTNLANAIISGQQEIAEKFAKLAALAGSNRAFYRTFAQSYTNLFADVFNKVDNAYKKVLSTGVLSKEEFDALGVEKLGITSESVGWVPWLFWSEDYGINSFYDTVDVNLCASPYTSQTSFTRFTFPDKFYYHSTGGGEDYKNLYLHVPFGSLPSSYTPYWVGDLNAYGPFGYEGLTGLFYYQFVEAIHTAIPEVSFVLKNSGSTVWYELEDPATMRPLLVNKLSKYGDSVTSGFPRNFGSSFLTQFRSDALYINLTDRYKIDHPECYTIYSDVLINDKTDDLGALVSTAVDTTHGIYGGFATAQITTTSEGFENRPMLIDMDITSSSFGQWYYRIKDFNLLSLTLGSYHTLHNIGMYFNFPDLFTYDFTNFFNGKFGEDITVSYLDDQLHKYSRKQVDVLGAERIFDWIRLKMSDSPSISYIVSKITTFDILVQLAELYGFRYLIAKVLLGHFHRINKK